MNAFSKETMNKFAGLFARASFSQHGYEKNMIIREIQTCFNDLDEKLYESRRSNDQKSRELEQLNKTYSEVSELLEQAKRRKSFIDLVNAKSSKELNDNIRKNILALDDEICHLNKDYLRYKGDGKEKTLSLFDNYSKKLEDFVYELRKRNLVVDQGNEVTDLINTEFGSLPSLVKQYEDLQKEISATVNDELSKAKDAILKRRKTNSITNVATRKIVVFLQKDLDFHARCMDILNKTDDFRTQNLKFRRYTDQTKDEMDFSTLIKDNNFKALSSDGGDKKDKLEKVKDALEELKKEYLHLVQVNDSIINTARSESSVASGRSDRLETIYNDLMRIYINHRTAIENNTNEIENISEQIVKVQKEKNDYELAYTESFLPVEKLLKQHEEVQKYLYRYNEVTRTLFKLCSFFITEMEREEGEPLIHTVSKYNSPDFIASLFASEIKKEAEVVKPKQKLVRVASKKKLFKPFGDIGIHGKRMRREESHSILRNEPKPIISIKPMLEMPPNKPIISQEFRKFARDDKIMNFFRIVSLFKVGGYMYEDKTDLLDIITKFRKEQIDGIHKIAEQNLEELSVMRNDCISKIRRLSNAILVKERTSIAIQSEKLPLMDVEVMTEEKKKKK